MLTKQELRKIVRERKREFTRQQLEELSLAVVSRIMAEPHFAAAKTVMLYCSLPDEIDTHRLLQHINDKTILLPKVTGDTTMELRRYEGQHDLEEGAFHIMEPRGKIFTDFASIDVAVVPGMAFDRQGNRLGRGKGYYDRFLSALPARIYKIGVCFDFQKFDSIPAEPTDVRMDIVV
ncbi:MAG: 5-formyltetrahydrofolate cyclo-ligase [Prevotellaceae bacterium]|nr:5-formyltetrahydrofolate cyclo-ligase [Prevotellaceae bacterium]